MSQYITNEFTFELPQGLNDRSVNIFAPSDAAPNEFSLVISRAAAQAGLTLSPQVSQLVAEMTVQFTRFQLHDRIKRQIGGIDAEEIRYSFRRSGNLVVQRQVLLLLPGVQSLGQQMINITGTFSQNANETWHETFGTLLDSFEIKR